MWNRSDSKTITYKNPPQEISEEDFHKQKINNYLHNTTLLQFVCEFTAECRITLHIAIGLFGPSKGPGGPGAVPKQEGIVGVEGIGPQLLLYLRIGGHRLPVHAQLHLGGNNHFPGTEGADVGLVVVLPVAGINQESSTADCRCGTPTTESCCRRLWQRISAWSRRRPAARRQEAGVLFSSAYPNNTSKAIMRAKPRANPTVPRLEWAPSAVSGISSSTTT